jgi:hypothetical protein
MARLEHENLSLYYTDSGEGEPVSPPDELLNFLAEI